MCATFVILFRWWLEMESCGLLFGNGINMHLEVGRSYLTDHRCFALGQRERERCILHTCMLLGTNANAIWVLAFAIYSLWCLRHACIRMYVLLFLLLHMTLCKSKTGFVAKTHTQPSCQACRLSGQDSSGGHLPPRNQYINYSMPLSSWVWPMGLWVVRSPQLKLL